MNKKKECALPELPPMRMTIAGDGADAGHWYSADQMRDYGQQCYDAVRDFKPQEHLLAEVSARDNFGLPVVKWLCRESPNIGTKLYASQLALPAGPTDEQILNIVRSGAWNPTDEQAIAHARKVLGSPAVAQPVAQDRSQIQRLKDAIEGECEGLAIDDKQATTILQHVGAVAQPVADEHEIPNEMQAFADDDAGRKAFVLGYNAALKDARAALAAAGVEQ